MKKILAKALSIFLIAQLSIPAFAGESQKIEKIADLTKNFGNSRPVNFESKRILTKPGDAGCFVDILKLGSTTSMTTGKGTKGYLQSLVTRAAS
jgi:hypothetical protein